MPTDEIIDRIDVWCDEASTGTIHEQDGRRLLYETWHRAESAEAEVRALTARLDAAHELVRASGALLCDYQEERGIWWDGFREALAGLRSSLGLIPDLTDTDLRAATADLTPPPTAQWTVEYTRGYDAGRLSLVEDLHQAVFGDMWARPESPAQVWAMLLERVEGLAQGQCGECIRRAEATPDLTDLRDAYGRYKKAIYGVEKRAGQADVLDAVAALVRSAQNDTDQ
jgi:hypothetical protein